MRLLIIFMAWAFTWQVLAKPPASGQNHLTLNEQKAFLQKMRKQLEPIKQLKANFKQVRNISAFQDKLVSHGIFYFQFPDKMRWEVTKPFKSLIIFGGKAAKKYRFKNGSWREKKFTGADFMKSIMEDILLWTKGDFSKTDHLYSITVFKNHIITLKPKNIDASSFISSISLSIERKTMHIRKVRIVDPGKDTVTISFTNLSTAKFKQNKLFKEPPQ